MAAFERLEDKVLEMEARSQAISELGGADLEAQFAALESGSDVDDELAAMKAHLANRSISQQEQKISHPDRELSSPSGSEVDDELEAQRKQIDNL